MANLWCGGEILRIAIVDDDTQTQKSLYADLTELPGLPADIRTFGSGEHFLACFEPGAFHLVTLDNFMGKLTGMDIARKIRETDQDVRLVFSTSSNEFASESYEVGACYYLHKPFGKDRLCAMINRLDLENAEKLRSLQLPDGQSIVLRDVLYADFAAHCVSFHCKQNRNIIHADVFCGRGIPFVRVPLLFRAKQGDRRQFLRGYRTGS